MQLYRYSLGLLELAFGAALLVIALCWVLVSQLQLYPPLGYLPAFLAAPLLFGAAAYAQKRLPAGSKLATTPEPPKYLVPLTFVALLLLSTAQAFLLPNFFAEGGSSFVLGLVVAGALFILNGAKGQTWLLAGLSLLLGLGLTLFAPPERTMLLYCLTGSIVLIPVGVATLQRELAR